MKLLTLRRVKIVRTALLLLLLFVVNATLGGDVQAQNRRGARRGSSARKTTTPRFGDYPVKEIYSGRPAPVRIDSRRARMFRSRLREGAQEGPNFAGHFTVVFWGCGTGCAQLAVVDARTGRIHWPSLEYMDIPDTDGDPGYRRDSRLLVVTKSNYDMRRSFTAYFYLIDKNGLRLIRRAEGDESNPIAK